MNMNMQQLVDELERLATNIPEVGSEQETAWCDDLKYVADMADKVAPMPQELITIFSEILYPIIPIPEGFDGDGACIVHPPEKKKELRKIFCDRYSRFLSRYLTTTESAIAAIPMTADVPSNTAASLDTGIRDIVLYTATRNERTCEISINGVLLSSPQPGSPYDRFAEFLFDSKNQNRNIDRKEIDQILGTQKMPKAISELGFERDLRTVFFGPSSNARIIFHNPITENFSKKYHLPTLTKFLTVIHSRATTNRNESE